MQRHLELGGGSSETWRTQLSFPHYPWWFSAFLKQFLNEALPTNPCFKVCFWWTNSKERDHVIKHSVLRSMDSHSVSLFVWLLGRYTWFTQPTNIKMEIHMWVIWLEVNLLFKFIWNKIKLHNFFPFHSFVSLLPQPPGAISNSLLLLFHYQCGMFVYKKKYVNTA